MDTAEGLRSMADEAKDAKATEGNAVETHTSGETQSTRADGLIGDLSKVDPKVLQSEIDRQVMTARKAWEDKLSKKAADEKADQERKAMEARGEYDKVLAQKDAAIGELQTRLRQQSVMHVLGGMATAAGLIDMDDLALLQADAVADAVDKDGTVDEKALQKLLDEFKAAKPHKFRQAETQTGPRFGGAPTPPPVQTSPAAGPLPGDYFKNEGLQSYVDARAARLAAMKRPPRAGGMVSSLADAVAERLRKG